MKSTQEKTEPAFRLITSYQDIDAPYNPDTDLVALKVETYPKEENDYGGVVPHLSGIRYIKLMFFSINDSAIINKGVYVYDTQSATKEDYRGFVDNFLSGKRIVGHGILFDLSHIYYNAGAKMELENKMEVYDIKMLWLKYFGMFDMPDSTIFSLKRRLKDSLEEMSYIFAIDKTRKGNNKDPKDIEFPNHSEHSYSVKDVVSVAKLFARMMKKLGYDRHLDIVIRNSVNVCLGDLDKNTLMLDYHYSLPKGYYVDLNSDQLCDVFYNITNGKMLEVLMIERQNLLNENSILLSGNVLFFDNTFAFIEREKCKDDIVFEKVSDLIRLAQLFRCKIYHYLFNKQL